MAKYAVIVPVRSVSGHQIFAVEAKSPEEAIVNMEKNGGDIISEEIEVTDLDLRDAECIGLADAYREATKQP